MNVCTRPFGDQPMSRSLGRIADALERYAPGDVRLVPKDDADLVIYQALGKGQMAEMEADIGVGRPYAVVQLCLASSDEPNSDAWQRYWHAARLVWSYYALPLWPSARSRFYRAPLGVDTAVFRPWEDATERPYLLATTGYVAESESLQECADAVAALGGSMLHLGPDLGLGAHVDYVNGISDDAWAKALSQCQYVSGLRRVEGFELPVLEGFACGAQPIVYRRGHYLDWFSPFAWTVGEGEPASVRLALERVLRAGTKIPFTPADRQAYLRHYFNWETIVTEFWRRLRA